MWSLVLAAAHVCSSRRGSSAALLGFLGVLQWYDLLQRGKFAFYEAVYRETSDWEDWRERVLPADALREVLCGVLLAPLWGVDMALPHLPFVAATDASSDYGLGGCTAPFGPKDMSHFAALSERDGAYVTLRGVVDKPRSRSMGSPHLLDAGFERFTTIFSVKLTDDDHINIRECKALLFYLRWLLRARARHRHRVVVLVDSKVVVGAVCKGRSGSPALNAWVRRIHCLAFAGGIRLSLIFIPSEHNPSDFPSRGLRLPGRRRRPTEERCPCCRVLAANHPLHAPKRLRGHGLPCGDGFGYAHIGGDWVPHVDLGLEKLIRRRNDKSLLRRCYRGWAAMH